MDSPSQIGDRPRHLEQAVESARGEFEATDGVLEQRCRVRLRLAVLVDLLAGQARIGFSLSLHLPFPRLRDTCPNGSRRFAVRWLLQDLRRHRGHFDLQVDAVEQRP